VSPAPTENGKPRTTPGGRWLLAVVSLELIFTLSVLLPLLFGPEPWSGREVPPKLSILASILLFPVLLHAAWQLMRNSAAIGSRRRQPPDLWKRS
jgi:hypothetical protein